MTNLSTLIIDLLFNFILIFILACVLKYISELIFLNKFKQLGKNLNKLDLEFHHADQIDYFVPPYTSEDFPEMYMGISYICAAFMLAFPIDHFHFEKYPTYFIKITLSVLIVKLWKYPYRSKNHYLLKNNPSTAALYERLRTEDLSQIEVLSILSYLKWEVNKTLKYENDFSPFLIESWTFQGVWDNLPAKDQLTVQEYATKLLDVKVNQKNYDQYFNTLMIFLESQKISPTVINEFKNKHQEILQLIKEGKYKFCFSYYEVSNQMRRKGFSFGYKSSRYGFLDFRPKKFFKIN